MGRRDTGATQYRGGEPAVPCGDAEHVESQRAGGQSVSSYRGGGAGVAAAAAAAAAELTPAGGDRAAASAAFSAGGGYGP